MIRFVNGEYTYVWQVSKAHVHGRLVSKALGTKVCMLCERRVNVRSAGVEGSCGRLVSKGSNAHGTKVCPAAAIGEAGGDERACVRAPSA